VLPAPFESRAAVAAGPHAGTSIGIGPNKYPVSVAAICAEHLRELRGHPVEESLERAMEAGLVVTSDAAALVEADPDFARSLPDTPAGSPAYS
jgi:hypothetical protein